MSDIRIRLPDTLRLNTVIEVKTLALAPPLPSPDAGVDAEGVPIPHFVGLNVTYDGRPVLAAEFTPGVSRDVMFTFLIRVDRTGPLTLTWRRQDGGEETRTVPLTLA